MSIVFNLGICIWAYSGHNRPQLLNHPIGKPCLTFYVAVSAIEVDFQKAFEANPAGTAKGFAMYQLSESMFNLYRLIEAVDAVLLLDSVEEMRAKELNLGIAV